MFLDAFFCSFFEHFSSMPISLPPNTPTHHPPLEEGGQRGVRVGWGEGGVFLDSSLEFL